MLAAVTVNLVFEDQARAAVANVQVAAGAASGSQNSFVLSFPANTSGGDLILVGVDFSSAVSFSSISDSQGNSFVQVGTQLASPSGALSRVYYAKNIKGGSDTITVSFSGQSSFIEVYLSEYTGVDPNSPVDVQAGGAGGAGAVSSGSATTTAVGDLIWGFCVADWTCGAGSGFTVRSMLNNNLVEDQLAGNPGAYAATGTANNGWTMQMVALRPASGADTTPPTVPTNLLATAVSPSQINLTWTASTDNVGVAGYRISRNGSTVGTAASASYSDTGLSPSTTYGYTVVAFDAAGNVSQPSASQTATTLPQDSVPPSIPTNLFGVSPFSNVVNLSWSASTDNVGVAGYQVFRNGVQVGTAAGTQYTDTGLAASTTYAYGVAAFDAAGNVSAKAGPVSVTTSSTAYGYVYPLKISGTGRYLVDQGNQPFFIIGEQGYTLVTELSNSDLEVYLSDRASRGYNVVWAGAADNVFQANPPYNYYGQAPFDGADFTNEDAGYWAHLDYVIQRAAAYNIVVFLDPAFVGLDTASGYLASYENSSDAVMTAYGAWLGARYQSFPNIVWTLGGDADPANSAAYAKLSDLANGLRSRDTGHLITFEASRFTNGSPAPGGGYSSLDAWGSPPPSWLNLNWVYLTPTSIPSGNESNYSRSPWLPPFMGEDDCEGEHSMTSLQLRQEGYSAILGGSYLGRIFCNYAIWPFSSPRWTTDPWQNQLGSNGSVSQATLGRLFRSRAHWLLVPDSQNTILTGGAQSGTTLAVAAATSNGQSVITYIPSQRTVTIDLRKITGSTAQANWFNPQTGAVTAIGQFPTTAPRNFTPPDSNDWVLVIDDASANLPPPGTGVLLPSPDTTPPTVPANLSAQAVSSSQVDVSWSASTDNVGVAGYRVFRNGSLVGSTTATTYIDAGLSPSTTYSYSVEAFDGAGNTSAASTAVSVTTPASVGLSGLSCAPANLGQNGTSTCTVTLSNVAPAGGAAVTVSSNQTALTVPSSVTVAAGATTATFHATTTTVSTNQTATVTASYSGSSATATISLQTSVTVSSLSCNPASLGQNATSTCTVTLSNVAPAGGAAVALSSNQAALTVPSSVTVAAGATTATFNAATKTVSTSQTATVTASYNGSSATTTISLVTNTVPPAVSIVSPVAGQTVKGTITLSANASDNVGVASVQFKVDGTNVGGPITVSPYRYSLSTASLTNASHTITAVATDLSGNSATSAGVTVTVSNKILLAQVTAQQTSAAASSLSIAFPANTAAGNLVLVAFDSNAALLSVTDSQGNVYSEAGLELTSPAGARSRVYWANNIRGGADTVTISFSGASSFIEAYLTEYSGVDSVTAINASSGAAGSSASVSSGSAATTVAGDLIYGFCIGDWACTSGAGFTARSTFNNNLIEDMTAVSPGSYAATAIATKGWTMQMVALKAAQ